MNKSNVTREERDGLRKRDENLTIIKKRSFKNFHICYLECLDVVFGCVKIRYSLFSIPQVMHIIVRSPDPKHHFSTMLLCKNLNHEAHCV